MPTVTLLCCWSVLLPLWAQTVVEIQNGSYRAPYEEARALLARGDRNAAIAKLNTLIERYPRHQLGLYARAAAYNSVGQKQSALGDLKRVLALNPGHELARCLRADILINLGQHDDALREYGEAIRLDPHRASYYDKRAVLLAKLRRYKQAMTDISKAIELTPDSAMLYVKRAAMFVELGRARPAIKDFDNAIRLRPDWADAYCWRAEAHAQLGNDLDGALKDYTKAILIEPGHVLAPFWRASIHVELGHVREALKDLRLAMRNDPAHANAFAAAAWILASDPGDAAIRDGKKAIMYARRACDLAGWKELGYLECLAAAYAESGDFARALNWQVRAVQGYGQNCGAEARKRLSLYRRKLPYRRPAEGVPSIAEDLAKDPRYPR